MKPLLHALPLALFLSHASTSPAAEPGTAPAKPATPTATYFAEDPVKWATPEVVLPPTYPKEALEKGVTAVVDATLNIKASGRLESISAIQSEPKIEAFEAAVEAVLKHWKFAQSFDASCRPIDAQSRLRVWFEIKEGSPSVSVTHIPAPRAPGAAGINTVNRPEVAELLRAGFPAEARMEGKEADVYTKLTVEPRSGLTQAVEVVTMTADPRIFQKSAGSAMTTNRRPTIAVQYGIATTAALMKARFEPGVAEGAGPISVCFKVRYRLGKSD